MLCPIQIHECTSIQILTESLPYGKKDPKWLVIVSIKFIQVILKKRFGNVFPEEETVISPGEMFNSEVLITVATEGFPQ